MLQFFIILGIVVAILLVLVVLIQNPKGGGIDSSFGAVNQLGSVRKTTDFIEKATRELLIGFRIRLYVIVFDNQIWNMFVKTTKLSSFQAIKTDIMEKIKSRHWSAGDIIPGEEKLAKEYGCSRMTVNRALRELAESGIVERKRKSGTRVAHQPDRAAKLKIPIVRKEIEAKGAVYRYALIEKSIVSPPDGIRAKLSLASGSDVLHVRCLHFADETPYQYEDRWINLDRVPLAKDERFEEQSPNEWLVEKEPFSEAEHAFSAEIADKDIADILGIREGDALFVVERCFKLLPLLLISR